MGFDPKMILMIPVLLFSVIIHECAHGLSAFYLGDDTAKVSGRLTLNPIPHIDIVGTIIFPVLMLLTHSSVIFGWAKPVPVNIYRLRKPSRDHIIVSLSGVTANFLLAVVFAITFKLFVFNLGLISRSNPLAIMFLYGIYINAILAAFNLMPIPPLDGSWVLYRLLPSNIAEKFLQLFPYGFLILLIMLFTGIFNAMLSPVLTFLLSVINLISSIVF